MGRVLLRDGEQNDTDSDSDQTEYVTELQEGERVIGHAWRESEQDEDFDV